MEQKTLDQISCFLGELIGTALLVFLGCMGCMQNDSFSNNHLQIVLNFGLVVMICVQSFGCVSGAHLNPAVTLAAYIYDLLTLSMSFVYFAAQMLGGFMGYGLLKLLIPATAVKVEGAAHALCVTTLHPQISDIQGLFIEAIITGCLILICCAVWDPRNAKFHDSVAIRFGLGVACLACTAGQLTGGSMNPARSFGPALWNQDFTQHWVYWLGPLGGSAITAFTYKSVFRREVIEKPITDKLRTLEEVPLS